MSDSDVVSRTSALKIMAMTKRCRLEVLIEKGWSKEDIMAG